MPLTHVLRTPSDAAVAASLLQPRHPSYHIFSLSAVASGRMFTRCWRLDEEGLQDVRMCGWLQGVIMALMRIGSCVGAAARAINMVESEICHTFGRCAYTMGENTA